MNWVGGARSRVKQSQERKIQKEFFERQKLAKKVNIHKQLSPKGHRKPISLDLLSLQTINQTHQGENGVRKQPVKIVLGDKSNLLPRRQEDLELPMSPIGNPSSLAFLDSKMEMDTHPRHLPHQLHKPGGDHEKQQAPSSKLQLYDYDIKLSSKNMSTLYTSRDKSQLSESLLSFHNSQEQLSSSSKHQKHIKQPPQDLNQCVPMPKKDLLAFQRAEKEKYMSSKPSGKQLPHQVTAYIAKPIVTSNTKHNDNLTIISDENPTVSRPSKSVAASVADISEKTTTPSNSSNDDLSDAEKKVLLGLDHDRQQDTYDSVNHTVPSKKVKTSSFEEMINNYERPITNKRHNKPIVTGKHEAWRKFTHEKSSPADDMRKVPDISVVPSVADRKGSLFFNHNLPKKPSMKRPPTVLQELLCLDEDLNNSDLFQTQDFTFEDVLAMDFEEPLNEFQHHAVNIKGTNENILYNHDSISIKQTEEVKMTLNQQDHNDSQVGSPKGESLNHSSGNTSVGVQCSMIDSLHDTGTQTEQYRSLKHSSTQSDIMQLVDAGVQATTTSCSITTQTLDDKCLIEDQPINYADELAMAQSTIVWQSLMIKILEVDANTAL